jgi:murein DD-endopeptidase MepM/ murein hydrolase activator NlpD
MITHSGLARTRVFSLNRLQIAVIGAMCLSFMLLVSGAVYHFIFLTAAREGWPIVSAIVNLVVRDEIAQRDRFMRENLDAIAGKVGEMQARMVRLEAVGDRVTVLAGVKPEELAVLKSLPAPAASAPNATRTPVRSGSPGRGGPYLPLGHPSLEELRLVLDGLDEAADQRGDLLTLAESRLFESRLRSLMVPNSKPIDTQMGSGFGFRHDPFTGRVALHTGVDFAADPGTPIHAAAGGLVLGIETHPQYGLLLEIDHGNGLSTRYAHTSKVLVRPGDLIKRGQVIALVGTSGRSTGPHLHFEVVVDGVPQDPAKFLGTALLAQGTSVASAASVGNRPSGPQAPAINVAKPAAISAPSPR